MISNLILATQSSRRRQLISQVGVNFESVSPNIDETLDHNVSPEANVQHIARKKAQSIAARYPNRPVLAADTIVVVGDEILGKPKDVKDAQRMLQLLSGTTHSVLTALCLIAPDGQHFEALSVSRVRFKTLSPEEITEYCQLDEPFDKAGAYAIQGMAAKFIVYIEGSFSGIMGLPLYETIELLKRL